MSCKALEAIERSIANVRPYQRAGKTRDAFEIAKRSGEPFIYVRLDGTTELYDERGELRGPTKPHLDGGWSWPIVAEVIDDVVDPAAPYRRTIPIDRSALNDSAEDERRWNDLARLVSGRDDGKIRFDVAPIEDAPDPIDYGTETPKLTPFYVGLDWGVPGSDRAVVWLDGETCVDAKEWNRAFKKHIEAATLSASRRLASLQVPAAALYAGLPEALLPDPLADPAKRAAYYGFIFLGGGAPEDEAPSLFVQCGACEGTGAAAGRDGRYGHCRPCRGSGSVPRGTGYSYQAALDDAVSRRHGDDAIRRRDYLGRWTRPTR